MQEHEIDEAAVDVRILKQLDHLEKILWVGIPPKAMAIQLADIIYILAPIGFFILLSIQDLPIPVWLWFIPIGFVVLVTLGKVERANVVYALTDRKAIIIGRLFARSELVLKLHGLDDLILAERADGSGTIRFGRFWRGWDWISELAPSSDKQPPHIKVGPGQARPVFALFEKARAEAVLKART